MENVLGILIPVVLIVVVLKIISMPVKLLGKLVINSVSGLICLWLLNWLAGFTGIVFPINLVTVVIAGFLGLPGIVLLALAQIFL